MLERDVRLTNTFAHGFVNELGADLNRIGSNLHGLMRMASSSLKDMQGNSNKKHGSDNRKHKDQEIKIVMVHENDVSKGACDFDSFFGRTPQGLIDQGIYKEIAIALHTAPHRAISLALVAQALGATKSAAQALIRANRRQSMMASPRSSKSMRLFGQHSSAALSERSSTFVQGLREKTSSWAQGLQEWTLSAAVKIQASQLREEPCRPYYPAS